MTLPNAFYNKQDRLKQPHHVLYRKKNAENFALKENPSEKPKV